MISHWCCIVDIYFDMIIAWFWTAMSLCLCYIGIWDSIARFSIESILHTCQIAGVLLLCMRYLLTVASIDMHIYYSMLPIKLLLLVIVFWADVWLEFTFHAANGFPVGCFYELRMNALICALISTFCLTQVSNTLLERMNSKVHFLLLLT